MNGNDDSNGNDDENGRNDNDDENGRNDNDDEDDNNGSNDGDENKICNMLNNMKGEMHDFDKKVKDKEHDLNVKLDKLDKLNNSVKN